MDTMRLDMLADVRWTHDDFNDSDIRLYGYDPSPSRRKKHRHDRRMAGAYGEAEHAGQAEQGAISSARH